MEFSIPVHSGYRYIFGLLKNSLVFSKKNLGLTEKITKQNRFIFRFYVWSMNFRKTTIKKIEFVFKRKNKYLDK